MYRREVILTGAVNVIGIVMLAAFTWAVPVTGAIAIGGGSFGVFTGLAFWTVITMVATARPVRMPRGYLVDGAFVTIIAATYLGGVTAGMIVAFVGTTSNRELRGTILWRRALFNHTQAVFAVFAAYIVTLPLASAAAATPAFGALAVIIMCIILDAVTLLFACENILLMTGQPWRLTIMSGSRDIYPLLILLSPVAWIASSLYVYVGWWAVPLALVPLYSTQVAHERYVGLHRMFTQVIDALSQAIDARDFFTSGHSHRVSEIAVDIGIQLGCSEDEIEILSWTGMLHDVGKIGVPDAILLKQGPLTAEEYAVIKAHPVVGAMIVDKVDSLGPHVTVIRHHHERWDGKGYPDGLAGEDIPLLARIIAVADSFDAMNGQRPYRMRPFAVAEALAELRRNAGTQFDPRVVDAFARTRWAIGNAVERFVVSPTDDPLAVSAGARRIAGRADQDRPRVA